MSLVSESQPVGESPQTPQFNKIRNTNYGSETPPDSPVYQVKYRDYQSAIDAIHQLENELREFQESSHELEKELEEELLNLELENTNLRDEKESLDNAIKELKLEKYEAEKSHNKKIMKLNETITNLNAEIDEKNARLVDIEILNDDIEQNERNLSIHYKDLEERYNNTAEKIIIIETELSDFRDDLLKERLNHQNTKNELNDWKQKYESLLETQGRSENIQRKPTPNQTNNRIPSMSKSNSLMQLHSMIENTKGMESRIGNIKSSLNSKTLKFNRRSSATTKVTNAKIITSTPSSITPKATSSSTKIPLSPSSYKLSSLANYSNHIITLEKIQGSPTTENDENSQILQKKRFSFGGTLRDKKKGSQSPKKQ